MNREANVRICWTPEGVSNSLFNVANLLRSQADYFLATHTPIQSIRDDATNRTYSEEALFRSIFEPSRNEVMAIIHGEPGSGKSHLIRWLKLRAERAEAEGELSDIRSVLVQRVSGSLKEALEQMLEQLGDDFSQYLEPVKFALSTISDATARRTLAAHLYLELGTKRKDRKLPDLPYDLKDLPDLFNAPGTREWLIRDGGVIDRNVQRLNQPSEASEREKLPEFSESEFNIPDRHLGDRLNPQSVELLGYDLAERQDLREKAASYCNESLAPALRSMTGLSGGVLQSVLASVRRILHDRKQQLAVFIEDVSVMFAIGMEVVNAFEPQSREGQCRMISVLGMVDTGMTSFANLPENQKQRATHSVRVGGDVLREWRQDGQMLAGFAARYLNVTRMRRDEVAELARLRRTGDDVCRSACDKCEIREHCHNTWGYVDFDSTRIGLFPFTPSAPELLLNQLRDPNLHTPRGLVMHVLRPVLAVPECLPLNFPPGQALALMPYEPPWWPGFVERYCANWGVAERARLRLLARAWVECESSEDAASQLHRFLGPLNFPPFTSPAQRGLRVPPSGTKLGKTEDAKREAEPLTVSPKLQKRLNEISEWETGGRAVPDADLRGLFFNLIRNGIEWELDSEIPPAIWRQIDNRGVIEFESQQTRAVTVSLRLRFPRSTETGSVLRALAWFDEAGQAWDFPDCELHKRNVARWLRSHTSFIRSQLLPKDIQPDVLLQAAIHALAVHDVLLQRKKLPDGPGDLLERLVTRDTTQVVCFSNEGTSLGNALKAIRSSLIDFVCNELDAPQGTGACVYIDPRAILNYARNTDKYSLDQVPEEASRDSRYQAIADPLRRLPNFDQVIESERQGLESTLGAIATDIDCSPQESPGRLKEAVGTYCQDLADLRKTMQATNFLVPGPEFLQEYSAGTYSQGRDALANAVQRARELLISPTDTEVLLFDASRLLEVRRKLRLAATFIDAVQEHYNQVVADLTKEGDPVELNKKLIGHLQKIAGQENDDDSTGITDQD